MGKSQRRIKNYLLQPLLQTKIGIYCILLAALFSTIIGGLLYLHLSRFTAIVLQLTDVEEDVVLQFQNYIAEVRIWLMLLVGTYLACTILVSVVYTHKLVGPTYAFRRHISALRHGNFKAKTFLRKSDAFKEVADELNNLSDVLGNKYGNEK